MQRQKNAAGHLILFTRFPQAGATKTRLIPAIGAEGAALLQQRMTEATFATLTATGAATGATLEVRCQGGDEAALRRWLPGAASYADQGAGDLGAKLGRAFAAAFAHGRQPIVAVGADCPALSPAHLCAALAALANHDLVIGPATDGGYYLIGLNRPHLDLFANIPWGTTTVLRETLARADTLRCNHLLLETLSDVDCPADLAHLGHHPGAQ